MRLADVAGLLRVCPGLAAPTMLLLQAAAPAKVRYSAASHQHSITSVNVRPSPVLLSRTGLSGGT